VARRVRLGVVLVVAGLAGSRASAIEGAVVDPAGKPVAGAKVCYTHEGAELLCSMTDAAGRFALPTSGIDTLRAGAPGFLPESFSGTALAGPVVLRRTPTLKVRLVEQGSGALIERGQVLVRYPSGQEHGPFPTNAHGVTINGLRIEGEVRIVGRAEGYGESHPHAASLVAGETLEVVLELARSPD
jgi:hypothetical protein